jgi:4-amino-4-deoxy-L-arabinose transferase-like glycosyltransferase
VNPVPGSLHRATRLILVLALFVTLQALFSVPRLSWERFSGNGGFVGIVVGLVIAGVAAAIVWIGRERWRAGLAAVGRRLERVPRGVWIAGVLLIGIVLRVLWARAFPAPQSSDALSYSQLAAQLARGEAYRAPVSGRWAEWPPGYPLLLAGIFLITGIGRFGIVLLNLTLFAGTVQSTDALARRVSGEGTARIATLLMALWPNLIATVGVASKELLTLFLVTTALVLWLDARASASRTGAAGLWLAAGLALGLASLAQPANLLFPGVLVAGDLLAGPRLVRAPVSWVVLVLGLVLIIAPWTLRNQRLFHRPVLISTNGGSVFYRANNPMATGAWMERGERPLNHLSELEASDAGYRWGMDWIRQNPGRFLALCVRKQVLFLGDDAVGFYETLKRGLHLEGRLYTVLKLIANAWWWLLWLPVLLALLSWRSPETAPPPGVVLLLLAVLYFWLIDSIFESGARHHVPLAGVVAVLVGLGKGRQREGRDDTISL